MHQMHSGAGVSRGEQRLPAYSGGTAWAFHPLRLAAGLVSCHEYIRVADGPCGTMDGHIRGDFLMGRAFRTWGPVEDEDEQELECDRT